MAHDIYNYNSINIPTVQVSFAFTFIGPWYDFCFTASAFMVSSKFRLRKIHKESFFNSLVTGATCYAGCLKIPCGRRPQALRDQLFASITHIKNRNRNSPPQ